LGITGPCDQESKRAILGKTVPTTGNPIDLVSRYCADIEALAIITALDAVVEALGNLMPAARRQTLEIWNFEKKFLNFKTPKRSFSKKRKKKKGGSPAAFPDKHNPV
jgi:hypothetical protein